jgi:hypothetical protein
MTISQENALYQFLENTTTPFTVEEAAFYIRKMGSHQRASHLVVEIISLFINQKIAFSFDARRWLSRRGCFEPALFVIRPTRMELQSGILIPGHRCVPFVNPVLFPHHFKFYWNDELIPFTSTRGEPGKFYPYYSIFGEEYAPQYVAQDNPENELAFTGDFYDEPVEVSLRVLDMRTIYRETSFVPGDRFVVKSRDWKKGSFNLERVAVGSWNEEDLQEWLEIAESGFRQSFEFIGPTTSIEEQIAFAYWYGGQRMRTVPAYSLEDFLYEKTGRIEAISYGIESRFWFVGKDIPDQETVESTEIIERNPIEELLYQNHAPVSRFVLQSYMRDAFYRKDNDINRLLARVVPPSVNMNEHDLGILALYLTEMQKEMKEIYSLFVDHRMGPVRQRLGELHTAVIDLAARLHKNKIDPSRFPRHTFILLSQILTHTAGALEDLDTDEALDDPELMIMDNSLDSMIETYEDIKERIDKNIDVYRRSRLTLIHTGRDNAVCAQSLQFNIGGTDIWRRVVLPNACRLSEVHVCIQACFGWKNIYPYRFTIPAVRYNELNPKITLDDISTQGVGELLYEYGSIWTVQVMFFARIEVERSETVHCTSGDGVAPPERIGGPIHFRRLLLALSDGLPGEKQKASLELGPNFDKEQFDLELCDRIIRRRIEAVQI